MSELTDKLKQRLEFDEDVDSTDGDDNSIKYLHQPRLKPILDALVEVVEALDTCADWFDDPTAIQDVAQAALAKLTRVLEEK